LPQREDKHVESVPCSSMQHLNVTATQGLVAAVANFALLMVLYLLNMNLLAEWWVGILALLIIVVFMFTGTSAARSANGGIFSFGQAWVASMSVAFIAQVVSAVLTLVLYQVIDPDLPKLLEEVTLEKTRAMMEGLGMSEDLLEPQMAEIKAQMKEAYTLKGMVKNTAGGMVMWGVISLLVAAISKRSPKSEFE
jgi:signal transduction histidine kinase